MSRIGSVPMIGTYLVLGWWYELKRVSYEKYHDVPKIHIYGITAGLAFSSVRRTSSSFLDGGANYGSGIAPYKTLLHPSAVG